MDAQTRARRTEESVPALWALRTRRLMMLTSGAMRRTTRERWIVLLLEYRPLPAMIPATWIAWP